MPDKYEPRHAADEPTGIRPWIPFLLMLLVVVPLLNWWLG